MADATPIHAPPPAAPAKAKATKVESAPGADLEALKAQAEKEGKQAFIVPASDAKASPALRVDH
jgi:hypothetical protein